MVVLTSTKVLWLFVILFVSQSVFNACTRAVIRVDLNIPTVNREEIHLVGGKYSARLRNHPNLTAVALLKDSSDQRRLKRHKPLDSGYTREPVTTTKGLPPGIPVEEFYGMKKKVKKGGGKMPSYAPFVSIGALSNMLQFFDNLKKNLENYDEYVKLEQKIARSKPTPPAEPETRATRPPATAAYLHAMRNQRPSPRIRTFVENPEPANMKGSNLYDPSYLWSGLGR